MGSSSFRSKCGACQVPLEESPSVAVAERTPCPCCGSLSRIVEAEIVAAVTSRAKLGLKHKRPGFKKPLLESVVGDDFHRASGHWNKLERVIDRENDRYMERIVDPETGTVLRLCDEPLSERQDRGSAKPKPDGGDA